jgi:hypothetical protein
MREPAGKGLRRQEQVRRALRSRTGQAGHAEVHN